MIGIVFLVCGLLMAAGVFRKRDWRANRAGRRLACYLQALGIVLCAVRYALSAKLELFGALVGAGVLLLAAGMYNLRAARLCRVPVLATYRGRVSAALGCASPVFAYEVGGRAYEGQSMDVLTGGQLDTFTEGQQGEIYVNAGAPGMFVLRRGFALADGLLVALGVGLMLAGVWLMYLV